MDVAEKKRRTAGKGRDREAQSSTAARSLSSTGVGGVDLGAATVGGESGGIRLTTQLLPLREEDDNFLPEW
jgi:hypothetical protein